MSSRAWLVRGRGAHCQHPAASMWAPMMGGWALMPAAGPKCIMCQAPKGVLTHFSLPFAPSLPSPPPTLPSHLQVLWHRDERGLWDGGGSTGPHLLEYPLREVGYEGPPPAHKHIAEVACMCGGCRGRRGHGRARPGGQHSWMGKRMIEPLRRTLMLLHSDAAALRRCCTLTLLHCDDAPRACVARGPGRGRLGCGIGTFRSSACRTRGPRCERRDTCSVDGGAPARLWMAS